MAADWSRCSERAGRRRQDRGAWKPARHGVEACSDMVATTRRFIIRTTRSSRPGHRGAIAKRLAEPDGPIRIVTRRR